jgi:hypothetical protein
LLQTNTNTPIQTCPMSRVCKSLLLIRFVPSLRPPLLLPGRQEHEDNTARPGRRNVRRRKPVATSALLAVLAMCGGVRPGINPPVGVPSPIGHHRGLTTGGGRTRRAGWTDGYLALPALQPALSRAAVRAGPGVLVLLRQHGHRPRHGPLGVAAVPGSRPWHVQLNTSRCHAPPPRAGQHS